LPWTAATRIEEEGEEEQQQQQKHLVVVVEATWQSLKSYPYCWPTASPRSLSSADVSLATMSAVMQTNTLEHA
jgi:hypothetical protein